MPLTEENSLEERNKTLIRSFIEDIFNEHNLSSIEKYFGKESVEGGPQAGKSGVGSKQFIIEFFNTFPDWRTTIECIVPENDLVVVSLNGSGHIRESFMEYRQQTNQ